MQDNKLKLSGQLAEFHLADIIQFLIFSHKTGELYISNDTHKVQASIFFGGERILHAQVQDKEGLAAFEAIYFWKEGHFIFISDRIPTKVTIDQPAHVLILNLQSRIDELHNLEKELPAANTIVAIAQFVDVVPNLNSAEWQALSLVNGRRTIHRICEKMNDELLAKRALVNLLRKGLLEISNHKVHWKSLTPQIKPAEQVNVERPYPPRVRTNLMLKSINGATTLQQIQENLKLSDADFLEDIRFLYETQWVTFSVAEEKLFLALQLEM